MKQIFKSLIVLLFCIGLTASLFACGGSDLPPSDASPLPPALDGDFVSEYGTMTFNGDGKSVRFDVFDTWSESSGLPLGKSEGTYVFLFRNEQWRYDFAETFCVTVGDKRYSFQNAAGKTGENTVAIYLSDGKVLSFEKEEK